MKKSGGFLTSKYYLEFVLFGLLLALLAMGCESKVQKSEKPTNEVSYRIWPSEPPPDCPFQKSQTITGVAFTNRHAEYGHADTWYPSWAPNGAMYSPFTDGTVGAVRSMSVGPKATTGFAEIIGDDPMHLVVKPLGVVAASPEPYGGRYPCGTLVYNGVWYYGTYVLDDLNGSCGNWCVLGPFVGFRISKDYGKTWIRTKLTPVHNHFGESAKKGEKVKIGSPHFVDFGKNMEHSPDGKAYLVAHGATRPNAHNSWISGDQIYLLRVTPSPENINDVTKYEFFAGYDPNGTPKWSKRFSDIRLLSVWNDHAGCVTMTYDAPLRKYLMCVTHGWPTIGKFDTYILESDRMTGPWRLVTYMRNFGEQGYFVNIPSKFISTDGRTAWLCYAANFTNGYLKTHYGSVPMGGRYGMCLHEIKMLRGDTRSLPAINAAVLFSGKDFVLNSSRETLVAGRSFSLHSGNQHRRR